MTSNTLCRKLRTKKMFITAAPADPGASQCEDETQASSHCWCNATLTETGPDDLPVSLQACTPSRPCFEQ